MAFLMETHCIFCEDEIKFLNTGCFFYLSPYGRSSVA